MKHNLMISSALSLALSLAWHTEARATQQVSPFQITRAIQSLQPKLADAKRRLFANAIHKASKKYGIEASTLVAIAQQESSFRDNLPEGAAGELGVCQILKSWVKNQNFRSEFGIQKESFLKNSANNFMVSAWLLSTLKKDKPSGTLPYWSFYNANRFENRLRYTLAVQRQLTSLKRSGHLPVIQAKPYQRINTQAYAVQTASLGIPKYQRPISDAPVRKQRSARPYPTLDDVEEKRRDSDLSYSSWIARALYNLAEKESGSENRQNGKRSLARTADEFEVSGFSQNSLAMD